MKFMKKRKIRRIASLFMAVLMVATSIFLILRLIKKKLLFNLSLF